MPIARLARVVAVFAALTLLFAACSNDNDSAKPTTTTTTTTPPNSRLSPVQVKALQSDLTEVGCFTGAVDGIVGPVTRAGIGAFQDAEGLTVDEEFGPTTEQKLDIGVDDRAKVCKLPPTPPPPTGPPCTSATIVAALPAGSSITDFGCAGEWAWAGIDVDADQGGYEATELLKAAGGGWTSVDRAQYCVPASNIPASIYSPGCTTN